LAQERKDFSLFSAMGSATLWSSMGMDMAMLAMSIFALCCGTTAKQPSQRHKLTSVDLDFGSPKPVKSGVHDTRLGMSYHGGFPSVDVPAIMNEMSTVNLTLDGIANVAVLTNATAASMMLAVAANVDSLEQTLNNVQAAAAQAATLLGPKVTTWAENYLSSSRKSIENVQKPLAEMSLEVDRRLTQINVTMEAAALKVRKAFAQAAGQVLILSSNYEASKLGLLEVESHRTSKAPVVHRRASCVRREDAALIADEVSQGRLTIDNAKEVVDVLDSNGDGCISPSEWNMRRGLLGRRDKRITSFLEVQASTKLSGSAGLESSLKRKGVSCKSAQGIVQTSNQTLNEFLQAIHLTNSSTIAVLEKVLQDSNATLDELNSASQTALWDGAGHIPTSVTDQITLGLQTTINTRTTLKSVVKEASASIERQVLDSLEPTSRRLPEVLGNLKTIITEVCK